MDGAYGMLVQGSCESWKTWKSGNEISWISGRENHGKRTTDVFDELYCIVLMSSIDLNLRTHSN